jgi:hypothetical protein
MSYRFKQLAAGYLAPVCHLGKPYGFGAFVQQQQKKAHVSIPFPGGQFQQVFSKAGLLVFGHVLLSKIAPAMVGQQGETFRAKYRVLSNVGRYCPVFPVSRFLKTPKIKTGRPQTRMNTGFSRFPGFPGFKTKGSRKRAGVHAFFALRGTTFSTLRASR